MDRNRASIEAIERQILAVGRRGGTLTADGVDRIRSMLAAHADSVRAARTESASVRNFARQSAAAVAAHLGTRLGPLVLSRFQALLPIAAGEEQGRFQGEAAAADYAESIAAMFAWESAAGPDSRVRAAIQSRLSAITKACRDRIENHLRVTSDEDFPDVRLLARDILRVEAVEWAVGIAGGPAQATELRHLAHHAARQAVQWAGKVFDRFKLSPDEFSHFDAVATVTAVDDLLVVILRVLEGDRDDRLAGSHPFVLTLGEQALQEFVDGLEHMTTRYLDIAETNLLADGPAGSFVLSVLQFLRRVLRLGHALTGSVDLIEVRLNHESTVRRMAGFRTRLRASEAGSPEYGGRLAVLRAALADVGA